MLPSLLAFTLLLLACLHFYWAAGGLWGKRQAIPERMGRALFQPSRLSTVAVGMALLLAAAVALLRGFYLFSSFPGSFVHWATVGLGLVFLLRAIGEFRYIGFFKRVRGTPFATWDTWVFSPLCLFIAGAFMAIAAS